VKDAELSPTRQQVARGADWIVTSLLIGGQALGSLVIGFLSLLLAMISDGCHDQPDDPFICSEAGGRVFFGGIVAEWLLLVAGVVVSIRLAVRASSRGATSWPKPFIGAGVGLVGVLVMVVTVVVVGG
jgi:hypothetical protein